MAVTISPSTEAMQAITDRINSSEVYELDVVAEYTELLIDPLEDINSLRVDVVSETEEQLSETIENEDRTTHLIRVWIRKKIDAITADQIEPLKLFSRQVFQRLNNYDSDDLRVKVWQCEMDPKQVPDKTALNTLGLFVASVLLRVEVEAS